MKCKHCGKLLTEPHYQTHAEGNYRGNMRCDPEDSGLPYGYNAAPEGVPCDLFGFGGSDA